MNFFPRHTHTHRINNKQQQNPKAFFYFRNKRIIHVYEHTQTGTCLQINMIYYIFFTYIIINCPQQYPKKKGKLIPIK